MEDLQSSLKQYEEQIKIVRQSLEATNDPTEKESLLSLQSDLNQLIGLTQESLAAANGKHGETQSNPQKSTNNELDDEYARFMAEMNEFDTEKDDKEKTTSDTCNSDIEEDLSSLLGMKCAVYHTHKWGGQPSLHNAMVSSIVPRMNDDKFNDLKVQILFTHPTHSEMLPCPFYLDGECKFSDEQCRYSHGNVVQLSDLKEAIDPNFSSIKTGSRILVKLKPPDDEDVSITKKSTEKYHLWHRAIVKSIDNENQMCIAKLEHGMKSGEKRKIGSDEITVSIEEIFPLNTEESDDSDSSEDLSDSEYSQRKTVRTEVDRTALIIEKSLQNNAPAMGEWERHTRGIGSKLMFAMGYVAGSGLGAAGDGRTEPVQARVLPLGKSLDHCMTVTQMQDPLKVEQRLKRLQKKEEERNKRAYEREKEKERRNVFNFINNTLGDKPQTEASDRTEIDVKQSTSKDLNVEKFKIEEDLSRIEREIVKLKNALVKYPEGTGGHTNINLQIREKNKELQVLQRREKDITKEQRHRKEKEKMTVF